jgi:hypothetical protein
VLTNTLFITGFPRSAFEAVHDESMKYRQLPCRTHISVGVCPYREKCKRLTPRCQPGLQRTDQFSAPVDLIGVFLHDPRCSSATAKSITRLKNKNKDDCVADSLYWPAMPRSMVLQYPETDRKKGQYPTYDAMDPEPQPHTVQPYCVPVPQSDQYHMHDAAVYSMWMHFVDFCLANASPCHHPDTAMCYAAVDVAVNPYARSKRLAVFRALCNGQHVSAPTRYNAPQAQQSHYPPQQAPMQAPHPSLNLDPEYIPPSNSAREMAPPQAPRSVFDVFSGAAPYQPAPTAAAPGPIGHPRSVMRTASPAMPPTSPMVRRNSAGSPVSVTDQLSASLVNDVSGGELTADGVEPWNNDCGVAQMRLQRQNLPQNVVSPLLMSSLF